MSSCNPGKFMTSGINCHGVVQSYSQALSWHVQGTHAFQMELCNPPQHLENQCGTPPSWSAVRQVSNSSRRWLQPCFVKLKSEECTTDRDTCQSTMIDTCQSIKDWHVWWPRGNHCSYLQKHHNTTFLSYLHCYVCNLVKCNKWTKTDFILAGHDIKGESWNWVGMLHGFLFLGDITIRIHMFLHIIWL